MNSDFENRLRRQTLRAIPSEWRREILEAANRAAHADAGGRREPHSFHPPTRNQGAFGTAAAGFHALSSAARLWPGPRAWAALGAVWIAIGAANFSLLEKTEIAVRKPTPPAKEINVALREQQRMLADLIGQPGPALALPRRYVPPQPRSESHQTVMPT